MTDLVVPTYSAAQVRAAEEPLLAAGVPLMMRASGALARIVGETLAPRARVLVLAGSGDNGGDALFAAAALTARAQVDVLTVTERWHAAGLNAAEEAGARRVVLEEATARAYDVVLDGILGIGAAPPLRGRARSVVETLLPSVHDGRMRVVAVDLPSGLHPDDGTADDAVLPATTTVTFGAVKSGLAIGDGPRLAGRTVLVRIGLELASAQPVGETAVARIVEAR